MIDKSYPCNPSNYDSKRIRPYKDIEYIAVHYTANVGDKAISNCKYFARTVTRTSAHYFIDREGNIAKSVNMNRIAWSVGDLVMNGKSVSIELCDIVNQGVSSKQKTALKKLITAIYRKCPNIKDIIRHYDVNGKMCPKYYVENPDKWIKLKKEVLEYVRKNK